MNHPTQVGGIGTRVIPISEFAGLQSNVYTMPGDISVAAKPLSSPLPDGWKHRKRRIVVDKSERILTVYSGTKRVKSYFIALGSRPVGPKTRRDDGKTPEGTYYICSRNPKSKFELSVLVSYPGSKDADAGRVDGLIDEETHAKVTLAQKLGITPPQDTALGSHICIHGGGIGVIADDMSKAQIIDWTQGCMAMRSEDIREIYDFAEPGTSIEIRP